MLTLSDFLAHAGSGTAQPPKMKKKRPVFNRTAPPAAAPKRYNTAAVTMPASNPVTLPVYQAPPAQPTARPKQQQKAQPKKADRQPLELVAYSDKSFAIFGDTKPVMDKLTELGGSFNYYLKRDGKNTPGYIFALWRMDSVKQAFNL